MVKKSSVPSTSSQVSSSQIPVGRTNPYAMTLDQRIQQDLTELLSGLDISGAAQLRNLFSASPTSGQSPAFSLRGMPTHFTGDRAAKTVMVMLNPGGDDATAVNEFQKMNYIFCQSRGISSYSQTDITDFIQLYKNYKRDQGHLDAARLDHFDVKQAAFIKHWQDSGVTINTFPRTYSRTHMVKEQLVAKENVLTQKLQLELIPYCSPSFERIPSAHHALLHPFLETIFEEILQTERKYVIFCSHVFEDLLRSYDQTHGNNAVCFGNINSSKLLSSNITGSCQCVKIHYNGQSFKALIAQTFPNRALPYAYYLMEAYGKFCYQHYLTCTCK